MAIKSKISHRPGKDGKSKGDITREKLLSAAIGVFSKKGFGEASFQDVADASGLKQSSIFYYFKTKEALIEAVMREVIGRGREVIRFKLDIRDDAFTRLLKYFRATVEWAEENPEDYQMLLLLYYFGSVRKEFSRLYAEILKTARERVLEILLGGERESLFTLPLGAEKSAELLHDALVGAMVNAVSVRRSGSAMAQTPGKWDDYIRLVTGYRPKQAPTD